MTIEAAFTGFPSLTTNRLLLRQIQPADAEDLFATLSDEEAMQYAMESGSSHARYALLQRIQNAWQVERVQVPYASEVAARVARDNRGSDWAAWLTTGRAP